SCSSLVVRASASTLFPYTTLFRSCRLYSNWLNVLLQDIHKYRGHKRTDNHSDKEHEYIIHCPQYCNDWTTMCYTVSNIPEHCYEDRKSTRLNSSHVSISYAVFCLK